MAKMMRTWVVVIAVAAAAGGCFTKAGSSAQILGPSRSSTVVSLAPRDAALEVVRLFSARGYALVEQQPTARGTVLRLKGKRQTSVRRPDKVPVHASAFYAFLEQVGDASTSLRLIGRPVARDEELCSAELEIPFPCTDPAVLTYDLDDIDGRAEAEVVQGVLTELALHASAP